MEKMIHEIAAGMTAVAPTDRAAILQTVEKVRDQYQDQITANSWLQEQLSGQYWD